jgi:hypothetical protein
MGDGLSYEILDPPSWLSEKYIENSQYFYLSITSLAHRNQNLTKYYLGYTGKDVSYSGLNLERNDYKSPVLAFGAYYKTQIAPILVKTIENVW